MSRWSTTLRFAALVAAFFALYALTAQRGVGWGDSGEFQHRILDLPDGILGGCESFAVAHPLYVALGKLLCRTPYQVTLLSAFFGALAVGGLFLCTRRLALAVLFGLSHMLWWLSCLAEVQTMNLAFLAFEALLVLRHFETGRRADLVAACFLAGVHLGCHNFALLAAPALLVALVRAGWRAALPAAGAGCLGAAWWLHALAVRGFGDVLVGRFGAKVAGVLPSNGLETAFNLALASLSFAVPAALAWWTRRARQPDADAVRRLFLRTLFAVHALFFVRYFVPDQATFLLPTLFCAYLLLPRAELGRTRFLALAALQVLLPVFAGLVLRQLPAPARQTTHKYRDDATYFAHPWKCNEDSAARYAAECGGTWTGYPR